MNLEEMPAQRIHELGAELTDVLAGPGPEGVHGWAGTNVDKQQVLEGLTFGQIRWSTARGRPAATLANGFTVEHSTQLRPNPLLGPGGSNIEDDSDCFAPNATWMLQGTAILDDIADDPDGDDVVGFSFISQAFRGMGNSFYNGCNRVAISVVPTKVWDIPAVPAGTPPQEQPPTPPAGLTVQPASLTYLYTTGWKIWTRLWSAEPAALEGRRAA